MITPFHDCCLHLVSTQLVRRSNRIKDFSPPLFIRAFRMFLVGKSANRRVAGITQASVISISLSSGAISRASLQVRLQLPCADSKCPHCHFSQAFVGTLGRPNTREPALDLGNHRRTWPLAGILGGMEYFFPCPYCGEQISMVLDTSVKGQSYVEDCEVCCHPIEVRYTVEDGAVCDFEASAVE